MHETMLKSKSTRHTSLAKIANLRKVIRMLNLVVERLRGGDSSAALAHSLRALHAAEAEMSLVQANLASLPRSRQQTVPIMPRDLASLIREDGTLRYVAFMKKSGQRPDVVAITFRVRGLPGLNTSFTLSNRDFNEVYRSAVQALARHIGVLDDASLVESMMATSKAFQIHYGLDPSKKIC